MKDKLIVLKYSVSYTIISKERVMELISTIIRRLLKILIAKQLYKLVNRLVLKKR